VRVILIDLVQVLLVMASAVMHVMEDQVRDSCIRSVYNQSTTRGKDEQYVGIWADGGYVAYAAGVASVGLWWGDRIVAAALPAAIVAYKVCGVVAGVVPGATVAEASPPNQRRGLR